MPDAFRFVVVRLCECDGNVKQIVAKHGRLTHLGHLQAEATRLRVEQLKVRVWASPDNTACLETAKILSGDQTVLLADEFSEPPYPKWAGLALAEVERQWPREWDEYWHPKPGGADRVVVPGGEPLGGTFKRIRQGLERLYTEQGKQGNVGIVTHGENVRLITVGLLDAPLENLFRLRGFNGAVTIFEFDGESAKFECINDSSHLESSKDLADYLLK
jgi:broad specificity phosphatase PhoE